MDEKRTHLKRRDTWIYKFWKGVLERMNHLEDVVKMLDSMAHRRLWKREKRKKRITMGDVMWEAHLQQVNCLI